MKTRRSQSGPFQEQVYYEDHEMESICADALKNAGYLPATPSPIRIDRFVEKHLAPIQYTDLGPHILGCTEFSAKGVTAVIISSALDEEKTKPAERRLRSTIAHEAGHGLLHMHLFASLNNQQAHFADWTDPARPRILCRDIDGASLSGRQPGYSGRWWEYQANRAIGALLLPKKLFASAVSSYGEARGLMGSIVILNAKRQQAISELADLFDVNPAVARIRLDQLYPVTEEKQMML